MQRYEKSFTFPQLVSFHFLSWRVFASSVGKFPLPQLVNGEGKCEWCINSELRNLRHKYRTTSVIFHNFAENFIF